MLPPVSNLLIPKADLLIRGDGYSMKKSEIKRIAWCILTALFAVSLALPAWAQSAEMSVGQAIHHDTSAPLRDMAPVLRAATFEKKQVPNMNLEVSGRYPDLVEPDGGLQTGQAISERLGPTPAPIVSAPGLSEQDNVNVVGTAIVPPDVNGDIGLDDNGSCRY